MVMRKDGLMRIKNGLIGMNHLGKMITPPGILSPRTMMMKIAMKNAGIRDVMVTRRLTATSANTSGIE